MWTRFVEKFDRFQDVFIVDFQIILDSKLGNVLTKQFILFFIYFDFQVIGWQRVLEGLIKP